ncbi:external DNA catabolism protein [Defluviimonas sp. 20V17]|uniref:Ribosomal RNA large subunit methyltransferase J n=1 Tax=Allgaiera indica TaxID=765699 RepID=A0AAN4UQF1_9RHOB|nr:23S rRNA (adenine(2030)-N(6))-methyltransferase RlmJ [Allgaiera indica]KDB03385.1 external DNA catabolism protein [Defluviimonas sp. 20V17]GHE00253.1 ribosomal RNA large subunit methyltransferase J [Allgaiera indica]SDW64882.1 23S rRNA (adenine2030-N6)-methyltransferase [Allgaiera indica]
MLSYQHIYHAGNLADVHKHALLAWTIDYLTRKPKPVSYLETHAGRGIYRLTAPEAQKTGEAAQGILRAEADGWFAPDHPYMRALTLARGRFGPEAYPGSPMIAALGLRPEDSLTLAELHPREHQALTEAMLFGQAVVKRQDGLEMALSSTPPTPRRGLMLIDPSYEVKADYAALPRLLAQIHRKWNVGIVMLWYPILQGRLHGPMLAELAAAFPDALRHEVGFPPAREGHGMIGSGIFVVNPPWGLAEEAARLSARFAAL